MRDASILLLLFIGVHATVFIAIMIPPVAHGGIPVTNLQAYVAVFIGVWAISIGAYIYAVKRNRPEMRRIMRQFFILLAIWYIGQWAVAIYFRYFGG